MSYGRIEFENGIERKIKISFSVFFGVIISFLIIYGYLYGENTKKEILLNIEKHTTVLDIYPNKEQHNMGYVNYSNGKNELLYFSYEIGDSISKNKGDSIEYIFRKDKIIKNNLLENYRNNK